MRSVFTIVAVALSSVVAVGSTGEIEAQAATCSKKYTRSEARQAIFARRSDLRVSPKDKRVTKRVVFCQKYKQSKRPVRKFLYGVQHQVRYVKTHKLPWCTYGPESGAHLPAFHPARYTKRNPSSTAAGKYQFLDSTWRGLGGPAYGGGYHASYASPLEQENMAHKYYRMSGGSPWVNC